MTRREFAALLAAAPLAAAPNVRVGCQTRSYYAPVKDRAKLLATLDQIAAAGFSGIETNNLCMADDFDNPGPMKDELAKRKLELFGLHLGARLHDSTGIDKARADTLRVAKGIRALGGSTLVMSPAAVRGVEGVELQSAISRKADELTSLSKICRDHGVRLAVHNHLEETRRGWAEFRLIGDKTRPGEVWFLVDVGPSGLTGEDPVGFLSHFHTRLAGLHIRDYKDGHQVKLGSGAVNLKGVAQALLRVNWRGWVLVENETEGVPGMTVDQAARHSLAYIKGTMGLGA
jgi:sugar phosphate isomerase/epimerase